MNSERRLDYGKLAAIGVIALLGLTLMGGALFAPKTVSGAPRLGIQAIVPSRSCDFVQLEQQAYAVCDDGSQGRVLSSSFRREPVSEPVIQAVPTPAPTAPLPGAGRPGGHHPLQPLRPRPRREELCGVRWRAVHQQHVQRSALEAVGRQGRGLPAFLAILDEGGPGRPGVGLSGKGGKIQYVAGVSWVDSLTRDPRYPYGTLVDVRIGWP